MAGQRHESLALQWRAVLGLIVGLILQTVPICAQSIDLPSLFNQVRQLYQHGSYLEAIPLAQKYINQARALYGDADPKTLIAQRNRRSSMGYLSVAFERQHLYKGQRLATVTSDVIRRIVTRRLSGSGKSVCTLRYRLPYP